MPGRLLARTVAALLLPCLLMACATSAEPAPPNRYVLVRHAEKAAQPAADPGLEPHGTTRAATLARRLAGQSLVAVYATQFRRTQDTAAPAARAAGVAITPYDAAVAPAEFAAALRRRHGTGTVLVVGHSNTIPGIVEALCSCATAPLREDQYDQLYTITFGADGAARLQVERY